MSNGQANAPKDDNDEIPPPQRPPSPPIHTTFAIRNIHPPTFSAFKPRDIRITSPQTMTHVAWNCDGQKLGAVGIDKVVRLWSPDKSMEQRSATVFAGGHSDDVDHFAWNPTHPELFCTSSSRDRRIVFWDARQSRHVQQIPLKSIPIQISYSPDGQHLLYTTTARQLTGFSLRKEGAGGKDQWVPMERSAQASTILFNHVGDGLVATHVSETTIRILDFEGFSVKNSMAAHVGAMISAALDPRGVYLASGGADCIVNLYDTKDWICARTITCSEHSINALSFSFDGEYLAIASAGPYIDICATETGVPLHRVPALGPAQTVQWHPMRHVIAYCGRSKLREGGPAPNAWISLFGVGH